MAVDSSQHCRSCGRRALTVLLACVLAMCSATLCSASVLAHATLDRSDPANGAKLAAAPRQIELYFGQQLVQNRTETFAIAYSDAGATVSDEARLDPADGKHLTLPLRGTLDAGRYTVFWKSTSDEDGGVTLGSFDFSIGSPATAVAAPGGQVLVPDEQRSRALATVVSTGTGTGKLLAGLGIGGAAGLALGGAAAFALLRRPRPATPAAAVRPARGRRR